MSVVIVNSYSGILTSFLTLPVYEKPINTLKDLTERTDIALTVPADSALLPTFLVLELVNCAKVMCTATKLPYR